MRRPGRVAASAALLEGHLAARQRVPVASDLPLRLGLIALVGVAACWSQPSTLGLPCASASECDADQVCLDGTCSAAASDASTDAASAGATAGGETTTTTPTTTTTEGSGSGGEDASGTTTPATATTSDGSGDSETLEPTTGAAECPNAPDCVPAIDWAVALGDGVVSVRGLAVDSAGATVIAGNFSGALAVGGFSFPAAPNQRLFVIKFAPNGEALWAKVFGDSAGDELRAIAIEDSDSILVTGSFFETLELGGQGVALAPEKADLFVGRLSPDGEQQALVGFSNVENQYGNAIASISGGDVVVVGQYQGATDLGGGPFADEPSATLYNAFIARLNGDLSHNWSMGLGTPNVQELAQSVRVGTAQSIYVGGNFDGALAFPGAPLTNAGGQDGYVARLSMEGVPLWSLALASSGGNAWVNAIELDAASNLYVVGSAEATVDVGVDVSLESVGGLDAYARALTSGGVPKWGATFGTESGDEFGMGVTVDLEHQHVLLSTTCASGIDFGGGALNVIGGTDACLARLRATDGSYLWSDRYGGDGQPGQKTELGGPLVARDGALSFTGAFFGSAQLGEVTLTGDGETLRPYLAHAGL